MVAWRYYAQRVLTNEWLDRDLRLHNVEIEWALSGPGTLTAQVDSALAREIGIDGSRIIDDWSTAIYAEADGQIRWGGIVRRSEAMANGWRQIEAVGFCGYPKGRIYDGEYKVWATDPFDIIRYLWNFVQQDPYGDIGVTVDQTTSSTTIGDPDPGPRPVRLKGETQTHYDNRVADWLQNKGDQYIISWWDAPDIGDEIDNLIAEAGGDYYERHFWTDSSKENVTHRIELVYPVIGRRRPDLRFVEGENIAVAPMPERDGDNYANQIIALGAGEGRNTLRRQVGIRSGMRLRRDKVVSNKTVYSFSRLRRLAETTLDQTKDMRNLTEITVFNHSNAPIGSWNVGDEIFIESTSSYEDISDWYRITSWSTNPQENDFATISILKPTTTSGDSL